MNTERTQEETRAFEMTLLIKILDLSRTKCPH